MVDITTFVPLPRKYEPLVTAPANAFIAPCAVDWPEPPEAIATVPVRSAAERADSTALAPLDLR